MSTIKLRESRENRLSIPNKKIHAKLDQESINSINANTNVTWSFEVVSSPNGSNILHSGDSPEGIFLNYETDPNEGEDVGEFKFDPCINISVDTEGEYIIKILSSSENEQIGTPVEYNLSELGQIETNEGDDEIIITKMVTKSENITLNYDTSEPEWI